MNMFQLFFSKSGNTNIPQMLFSAIREQSRQTMLFSTYGVPDTVMGRFDMLALHTYLFANRLKEEKETRAASLNQDVFDLFVDDVERALRELGIGDTTVPKRKKRMVRSFYGQIEDFDESLSKRDIAVLRERVARRYGADVEGFNGEMLARYMIRIQDHLAKQSYQALLQGELAWAEV